MGAERPVTSDTCTRRRRESSRNGLALLTCWSRASAWLPSIPCWMWTSRRLCRSTRPRSWPNGARGRNIALVGHFPFVPELRSAAAQLWVIEQQPVEGDYPAEAASDLIPRADLVAITGSALINGTLDALLALRRPEAMVMLLGPSTPLSPILFDHGVDILSGTRVADELSVLRAVGQGASFRQVEGVKLLTFVRPEAQK